MLEAPRRPAMLTKRPSEEEPHGHLTKRPSEEERRGPTRSNDSGSSLESLLGGPRVFGGGGGGSGGELLAEAGGEVRRPFLSRGGSWDETRRLRRPLSRGELDEEASRPVPLRGLLRGSSWDERRSVGGGGGSGGGGRPESGRFGPPSRGNSGRELHSGRGQRGAFSCWGSDSDGDEEGGAGGGGGGGVGGGGGIWVSEEEESPPESPPEGAVAVAGAGAAPPPRATFASTGGLPVVLAARFFSFRDVARTMRTCRALRAAVPPTVTALPLSGRRSVRDGASGRRVQRLRDHGVVDATVAASCALFRRVEALDLSRCRRVTDAAGPAVASLAGLRHLALVRTQVRDLGPIAAGCRALASLGCEFTPVADLAPLAGARALTSLNLTATPVRDLGPLASCPALETLVLTACANVTDATALGAMPALRALTMNNVPLADARPLARARALTSLDLSGTRVGAVPDIAGLRSLSVSGTRVASLEPCAGMPHLAFLFAAGTQVCRRAREPGCMGGCGGGWTRPRPRVRPHPLSRAPAHAHSRAPARPPLLITRPHPRVVPRLRRWSAWPAAGAW